MHWRSEVQGIPVLNIAYGFFAQTIDEPRTPGSAGFFKDSSAGLFLSASSCLALYNTN